MPAPEQWYPILGQLLGQAAMLYAAVQVLKAELRHVAERVDRHERVLEAHDKKTEGHGERLARLEAQRGQEAHA